MTRTLVLLTLNEIDGVTALLPAILAQARGVDELMAVDGGSTDGTRELLRQHGVHVVAQTSQGRGEAFRVAVAAARGEHLVFFSPDGNEDLRDIPRLFEQLEAGAAMVIASRFLPGARNEEDEARLPLRKWVNQAFTWLANALWNRGPYVTDTINGFRGVTRAAFAQLAPRSVGYTIEYEMTIHAMKQRLRIVEIPTIEGQRIGGTTKAPSWRTGLVFVRCFLHEVFERHPALTGITRVVDGGLFALLLPCTSMVLLWCGIKGHARQRARPAAPRLLLLVSTTLEQRRQRGELGRVQRSAFGYFERVWHLHSFGHANQVTRLDATHAIYEFAVDALHRLKQRGWPWTSRLLYGWALLRAATDLVVREHITVIDSADPFLTGLQAYAYARLTGIPYTVEIHRDFLADYATFGRPTFLVFRWVRLERAIGRFVLRHAARVIVDRDAYAKTARLMGVAPQRLLRTRLVADPAFYEELRPLDVREQFRLPQAPLVLYVGRLSEEKYPADILHAGAAICAALPEPVLVIAGDGPMQTELMALAERLGIRPRVYFLGQVRQPHLRSLMSAAAVILCPNAGLTLLEAALCRCPIVAYDSDWHPEIVPHGEAGLLVPHRDVSAMAAAALELLRHPARAQRLGQHARNRLLHEHAPERFEQEMRAGFQAVASATLPRMARS